MGRPKGSKSTYTVTSKAVAQRRKNSALIPAETDEEKNYNARQIEHVLRTQEIAKNADRNDLLSLKSCFIAYLRLCQEDGFKVGNLGAYTAMGMDAMTFSLFSRKDDPDIREFCKFVKSTCAMFMESMVAETQLNPVIGIFWQRNFDGLRNDTEQAQAAQEIEEENYGNKSYKDKYRNIVEG